MIFQDSDNSIDNFRVGDPVDEVTVWGCKLNFGTTKLHEILWKSRKCPPWFVDSFVPRANIFSFPDLQAAYKYNYLHLELKLKKYIWLPIS